MFRYLPAAVAVAAAAETPLAGWAADVPLDEPPPSSARADLRAALLRSW